MNRWFILSVGSCCFLLSLFAEEAGLEGRVKAHLAIGDTSRAIQEASLALQKAPQDLLTNKIYLEALAAAGRDREMVSAWKQYAQLAPEQKYEAALLETMGWAVIENGAQAASLPISFYASVGAFLTNDAYAVRILKKALHHSNAVLRGMAVDMVPYLRDVELQDELLRMFREERSYAVRLQLLQASGRLRLEQAKPALKEILTHSSSSLDERVAAVEALVTMQDDLQNEELKQLVSSNRAGMRLLACHLVAHFGKKEFAAELRPLLTDNAAEVRQSILCCLGYLGIKELQGKPIKEYALAALHDPDMQVRLSAAWLLVIGDEPEGSTALREALQDASTDSSRLAAAVILASGKHAMPIARCFFNTHPDPFVRATLCVAMGRQRIQVQEACAELAHFLTEEKRRIMWHHAQGSFFTCLMPSDLSHNAMLPQYPELANQATRLELLNSLAVWEYPQALEAVTLYFKKESWRVSGMAALTLLQEGDQAYFDLVRKLLQDADESLRVQAALALAMWGRDEEAVHVLEKAYPTAARELKIQILDAIGQVGLSSSVPFLVEQLDEPFQGLRLVAASSLIRCLNH